MTIDGSDLLHYFNERRDAMLDAIREIVEIDSPSYDESGSRSVADLVASWFAAVSDRISIRPIDADGYGRHLVIDCFAGDGQPTALLGHLDTVHPPQNRERNPTRIDGDRFYGCGIFDMKANVVLMVEALRYLYVNGIDPGPIRIFLACDEEVGSHSGRAIIESELANAARCFVFEPSAGGRVKTGRKGTGMYTVTAHGIPAHAGLEPERGANAILELARRIDAVSTLNKPEVGTTVNVCTIAGGTTSNVIPDEATCSIDVRFTSMSEAKRIDEILRTLSPTDDRVTLEVGGGINRPPLERTDAVIELFERSKHLASSIGYDLGETQVGGASDGNFVGAMGVPVLDGLGIAGDGAHTLDEYILVDDIVPRAALVTMLLADK